MTNKELVSENETLKIQIAELQQTIGDLKSAQSAPAAGQQSKSKQQAEAALAMLNEKGSITLADLKTINEKYPSDPIYFLRSILKVRVTTSKIKGQDTRYMLERSDQQPEAMAEAAKNQ